MTRVLLTNDDGIDAPGLHAIARRVAGMADFTVVAPATEHSGMSAALGPFYLCPPRVHERKIDGFAADAVWAIEGPPSLGVLLAQLGAFGEPPDIVLSGINPGLNVGRAVYHSGTVGATLTARNAHIHGIAVSQDFDPALGLHPQNWETAAEVGAVALKAMIDTPPPQASVLNLNVPDCLLSNIKGIRAVPVGTRPPAQPADVWLESLGDGVYTVHIEPVTEAADMLLPPDTDTGAVLDGWVSMSWLGRLSHEDPGEHGVEEALERLFGQEAEG